MGWVFFGVVVIALVWLMTENRTARLIAVGFAVCYGVVALAFIHYVDRAKTSGSVPGARPGPDIPRIVPLPSNSIALIAPRLQPAERTVFRDDGTSHKVEDLTAWRLTATLRAANQQSVINDVTLRVRLFSCPEFYRTGQGEAPVSEFARDCITIGERSVTLYKLGLKTGEEKQASEAITFDSQREAVNWRYSIDVDRVTAVVR